MHTPERVLALIPDRMLTVLRRHPEAVKFAIVGGTCYLITTAAYEALKHTVLTAHAVTALIIANVISTVVSYLLNREWSFREHGGRRRHTEMTLFIVVNVFAIGLNAVPDWVARQVFHLYTPHVSLVTQEVSDFLNGMVLGTVIAMVFRLWAFQRWVFPKEKAAGTVAAEETDQPVPVLEKV